MGTRLLHTFTPTPVPFPPHGMTPPSLAILASSGVAKDVASGVGEPNMIVNDPAVAATVPAMLSLRSP